MFAPLPLAVEAASRTTFEFGRIQSNSDWILPIAVCISILLLVRFVYRLDTRALGSLWGWVLTAFRSLVFLACWSSICNLSGAPNARWCIIRGPWC